MLKLDKDQRVRLLDYILRVEAFLHGNIEMRHVIETLLDEIPLTINEDPALNLAGG